MTDCTPRPDQASPDPTADSPTTVQWLPVTHRLTRRHDASVISAHCYSSCGLQALEDLTLATIIGPNSPGPSRRSWPTSLRWRPVRRSPGR